MNQNRTANASETRAEVEAARRKLKAIEASLQYSTTLAGAMLQLCTRMVGRGRPSKEGGK